MRLRATFLVLALALLGSASPGRRPPGLEGVALGGQRVNLSALRGRVVVVDFCASWCEPCRRSMPRLQALDAQHRTAGLTVLAVSVDDSRAEAERFVRETGVTFPVMHDATHGIAEAWSPAAMPTTVVIDRQGVVRSVLSGEQPGQTDAAVRALLRGT
jgi:peroxiredoxin